MDSTCRVQDGGGVTNSVLTLMTKSLPTDPVFLDGRWDMSGWSTLHLITEISLTLNCSIPAAANFYLKSLTQASNGELLWSLQSRLKLSKYYSLKTKAPCLVLRYVSVQLCLTSTWTKSYLWWRFSRRRRWRGWRAGWSCWWRRSLPGSCRSSWTRTPREASCSPDPLLGTKLGFKTTFFAAPYYCHTLVQLIYRFHRYPNDLFEDHRYQSE